MPLGEKGTCRGLQRTPGELKCPGLGCHQPLWAPASVPLCEPVPLTSLQPTCSAGFLISAPVWLCLAPALAGDAGARCPPACLSLK